jgi:hypothetical protein
MAVDLRDKLQPIGRLEILNAVIAKVQEYYKAFPAQDEAIDVLRRRSAALVNQAEVLLVQGKKRPSGIIHNLDPKDPEVIYYYSE